MLFGWVQWQELPAFGGGCNRLFGIRCWRTVVVEFSLEETWGMVGLSSTHIVPGYVVFKPGSLMYQKILWTDILKNIFLSTETPPSGFCLQLIQWGLLTFLLKYFGTYLGDCPWLNVWALEPDWLYLCPVSNIFSVTWASYLSLCLIFFICRMGIIRVPTYWSFGEDEGVNVYYIHLLPAVAST